MRWDLARPNHSETVQVSFKRGQRVAVEVDSMTIEKGTRQVP
jgi:hypothetical protein